MSNPMQQYSRDRIGSIWTPEDHALLCHVLDEVDRTAEAMVAQVADPSWLMGLRGAAPNATGELSSEEFVRQLRDAWSKR